MKALITLSVLSVVFAACGSSNNTSQLGSVAGANDYGIDNNGNCDSKLINSQTQLALHYQNLTDSSSNDEVGAVDRECQSFRATYPNTSCRANLNNQTEAVTIHTSEAKQECDALHSRFDHATRKPRPRGDFGAFPVATPTATPAIVTMSDLCSNDFISAYSQIKSDTDAVNAAGNNFGRGVSTAEKLNQDCKTFQRNYPTTVCRASDANSNDILELDSHTFDATCKKIADYLKNIHGGNTTNDFVILEQSLETIQ